MGQILIVKMGGVLAQFQEDFWYPWAFVQFLFIIKPLFHLLYIYMRSYGFPQALWFSLRVAISYLPFVQFAPH